MAPVLLHAAKADQLECANGSTCSQTCLGQIQFFDF